jgi:hypothetical protein
MGKEKSRWLYYSLKDEAGSHWQGVGEIACFDFTFLDWR